VDGHRDRPPAVAEGALQALEDVEVGAEAGQSPFAFQGRLRSLAGDARTGSSTST
jgi:hypothetical protein